MYEGVWKSGGASPRSQPRHYWFQYLTPDAHLVVGYATSI